MTEQELAKRIERIFVEEFEIAADRLRPEAHIFGDLGLDSLDVVDLIVALQKEFKVQVRDDERVREIRTLQDLHDYLETLKREQGG